MMRALSAIFLSFFLLGLLLERLIVSKEPDIGLRVFPSVSDLPSVIILNLKGMSRRDPQAERWRIVYRFCL